MFSRLVFYLTSLIQSFNHNLLCIILYTFPPSGNCGRLQCQPGHRCDTVDATGEVFCNPTCDVDNGGCDPDLQNCIESVPDCIDPSEPCKNSVECPYKGQFNEKIPTQTSTTPFLQLVEISTFLSTCLTVRCIGQSR